jgi:hypothetical protein
LRTTAPPKRPEVTNPARHESELSTGIAFNIRSLPRCVRPFCFTRSYSERCVRRRAFGKESEPANAILIGNPLLHAAGSQDLALQRHIASGRVGYATSVQKKSSTGIRRKTSREKESRQFIARATQQVFPLRQPAIQWLQLEIPLQRERGSSFQSPQVVGS